MNKIVFATGNEGKLKEIREIMEDSGITVFSMKEAGYCLAVEETGTTFEENAILKARALRDIKNEGIADAIIMADDSGLEVDYLNGEPGIYSARYAGEDTSYLIKNRMILDRMKGVGHKERSARFVCAIAAILPDGRLITVRGTIEGFIAEEPAGENGFGYDPIFYLEEYGCTTAQLSVEIKNKLSHRGKALRKIKKLI